MGSRPDATLMHNEAQTVKRALLVAACVLGSMLLGLLQNGGPV